MQSFLVTFNQNLQRYIAILFTLACVNCFFNVTLYASQSSSSRSQTTASSGVTKNVTIQDTSLNYDTPPSYPGGQDAWMKYLIRNLRYPQTALAGNIGGQVIVSFTINENGRLSNFKADTGHRELRQEAIRLIRHGGKWKPAQLNGKAVASRKDQAVTFVPASF